MRYTILAFAAGAASVPLAANTTITGICSSGLFTNPQCCGPDVTSLNCGAPSATPMNTDDFVSGCVATNQQAKCCVTPISGQGLRCQDVSPSAGGENDAGDKAGDDNGIDANGDGEISPTEPSQSANFFHHGGMMSGGKGGGGMMSGGKGSQSGGGMLSGGGGMISGGGGKGSHLACSIVSPGPIFPISPSLLHPLGLSNLSSLSSPSPSSLSIRSLSPRGLSMRSLAATVMSREDKVSKL